jgi:hypothetical protein
MSTTTSTELVPWAGHRELAYDLDLAERLAAAHLLPAALRQKPADLLLIMLHGRDLGLSVSQALRGLHVVEGKVVLSADLMLAMCLKRPDVCEHFRLVASSDQVATYEAKRRGQPAVTLSWTMAQAQAAGLAGRGNWRAYPASMLRARCIAALARVVFADLLFGVYDADELASSPPAPAPIIARPTAVAEPVEATRYAITPAGEAALGEEEGQAGRPDHITEASGRAPELPPEVVQRAADAADALELEVASLVEANATAPTVPALEALVPRLAKLPQADRDAIRPGFNVRKADLVAAAQVAGQ